MDNQILLILSACEYQDKDEEEKIKLIAKGVNKFYILLQLQKCYDSNEFNEHIISINMEIRNKDTATIKEIFDNNIKEIINKDRAVNEKNIFNYNLFKDTGMELNKKFKRYFFARIEKFIANLTNMEMKYNLYYLVVNTGSTNGFHIEHILAYNNENLQKFIDEDEFERERNRLGALLLLKGRDNMSSNNESYNDKLVNIASIIWN